MPYDLAQTLLTVLFDFVTLFGFFFVLTACAAEASRRKDQSVFHCSLQPQAFPSVVPLALPAAETVPLTLTIVSPLETVYEYATA